MHNADPTIRVTDHATRYSQSVPIAVMQGVIAGLSDDHYGDNVSFMPSHSFTALVNPETARPVGVT